MATEIKPMLATVVRTGAPIWQHAVVEDGKTIAVTSSKSDAQAIIDARDEFVPCTCPMCEM